MARALVCLTFDFDTVAYWIAQGQTTPTPISRGEFGVVASSRLVELFRRHSIATTWFVPGLTIDTYPDACRQIADTGHEIAHHGYDHVAPRQLSRADEADQLERGITDDRHGMVIIRNEGILDILEKGNWQAS